MLYELFQFFALDFAYTVMHSVHSPAFIHRFDGKEARKALRCAQKRCTGAWERNSQNFGAELNTILV